MKPQRKKTTGVPRLILLGAVGALAAAVVSTVWDPFTLQRTTLLPDAYRVPKIPGGTALRMAMVHDVLHERYLRHGTAWYEKRNESSRAILARQPVGSMSEQSLDAMDDLAVGLERVGQFDEAIRLMREKARLLNVKSLPTRTPPATAPTNEFGDRDETDDLNKILAAKNLPPLQHQQYTACANLGTILLISSMGKAMADDKAAIAQMRESLQWVEQAIAINPGGHFGRERWQAILIEHLLAAIDQPDMDILKNFDFIGDELAANYGESTLAFPGVVYARNRTIPASDASMSVADRLAIRRTIKPAGMTPLWAGLVHSHYTRPMPFDEPTLAIIGMWTMGGGPNPHFALALGRLMEHVGQRAIAWNAYERAVELQDGFWPDKAIRDQMVEYCRDRQAEIAGLESSGDPDGWQKKMRSQHQAELAWGIAYQKAYQDFEAKQIAAGMALDDPNFYAAFFKDRPTIASDPGLADDLVITHLKPATVSDVLPMLVLGIGVGMFLGLVLPERHLSF